MLTLFGHADGMTGWTTGDPAPYVMLAHLVQGVVTPVPLRELLSQKRVIAVGVPGAFTPVCTEDHIPDFVQNANRLRASGFDRVMCIAPNDPWTLEAWACKVDPNGAIEFYSDGNLALARALGATITDQANFLGETSGRYLMITRNGMIERLTLEAAHMCITCTRSASVTVEA